MNDSRLIDHSLDVDDNALDAFEHLTWSVGATEDQPDGTPGEWMACFDARHIADTDLIEYHVVVDTGTSVDTVETKTVSVSDEAGILELRAIPCSWHYKGMEQDLIMDEKQLFDTEVSWKTHIDELMALAALTVLTDDVDALIDSEIEQSADYFNRYIAGDR